MPAQVIDFLEPVQINTNQRHLNVLRLCEIDFVVKPAVETHPVGQPGQAVGYGHLTQLLIGIGPYTGINQIAGHARPDDQEPDTGNGKGQRLNGAVHRLDKRNAQWFKLESCHAGKVQENNRCYENANRCELVTHCLRFPDKAYGNRRQHHRERNRQHQQRHIPAHDALHRISHHPGIVHRRDRKAHEGAAHPGGQFQTAQRGETKARNGSGDGYDQRNNRQYGIKREGNAGIKPQHGYEMRTPDRRAGGHRCQDQPACPLKTCHAGCAPEELQRHPGARKADHRGQHHKSQIMLPDMMF